ncbi:unnamed protein product [Didymodactylos carnosus]|uniref:Choline transporter-like protein n=1 Tax=Didymodactylos carnosus TaxID=1234261 RepID=A0A813SUN1_9BILA|nr:unnamed protein product [Didymodactylos carnosus]CAF0805623.1 unnamed protein product [Didymodactylos carnosus]CAF3575101.1 unnamed protein product [Didymodactylos carnosus]CAF3591014.1 unnamed protein product [Didymodactylos carnosus]
MDQPLLGSGGAARLIDVQKIETLPNANEKPQIEGGGWKDRGFAIAFWIHVLCVVIIGLVLGIPAIRYDTNETFDDSTRKPLDFDASLFLRIFMLASGVGGFASVFFFFVLQRCAGQLIKCSLYTGLFMQIVFAAVMFKFAWGFGIFMLLFIFLTIWYIYYVRNRIPFAEAHIKTGCAALARHPSVYFVALGMLIVQCLWVFFWSMLALGFEHAINDYPRNSTLYDNVSKEGSKSGGGIFVFVLLVSLYWGSITFKTVVHFVSACVVGDWWFTNSDHIVRSSVNRAFTTNFGSLAFGSLIVAVIKSLRTIAQNAQNNAQRQGNIVVTLITCCAACILQILERVIGFLNEWAFIFCALTGASFIQASKDVVELFKRRGWTLIINDDLTGNALAITSLAVGFISAAIGGITVYTVMPHNPSRIEIAGIGAFFCFLIGLAMSTIMTSILTSCVRTVFVCFALNPSALASTHPEHLSELVTAWYRFHPQEFAQSGYAYHLPKPPSTEV